MLRWTVTASSSAPAEALGTFLFFFLGFNAIAVSVDIGGGAISTLGIAFAFGLGLAMAITALGHISGGHFNPAVSLGLAIGAEVPAEGGVPVLDRAARRRVRRRSRRRSRLLGAAVDALDTAPGVGISSGGALLLELIATALFVIVICTVATDDRAPWKGVMAPLLIGLFIFTAADAIGPASGGSFNPARSLDPAIFNWDFSEIWIYLVGPLVGGMIGGAIWVLFGPDRAHEPATIRATGGVPQAERAASPE